MMNHSEMIRFYQLQLVKFRKFQANNIHVTEHGARISDVLIGATERRLKELRSNRDIAILDTPICKNGEQNDRI